MAGGIHCRPLFKESTDMGLFRKILDFLDNRLEMTICIALMSVLSVVLFIQVFFRYVLGASLSWSEELARYMFIWLVYIGIAYGCKVMRHIKIDAGLFFFPKALRPYVVIMSEGVFAIFAAVVAVLAFKLVGRQMMIGSASPAMGIPMWVVYMAPCVGFTLTTIRQIQALAWRLRHFNQDPQSDPMKA